jgi:hypothetical protein
MTILRSLQCWPLLQSAMLIDFVCFVLIPADRSFLELWAVRWPTLLSRRSCTATAHLFYPSTVGNPNFRKSWNWSRNLNHGRLSSRRKERTVVSVRIEGPLGAVFTTDTGIRMPSGISVSVEISWPSGYPDTLLGYHLDGHVLLWRQWQSFPPTFLVSCCQYYHQYHH